MTEASDRHYAAFVRFMQERKLKITPWARKAGVSRSAINNYLTRSNSSMTAKTLEKLAAAAGATVAELIGEEPGIATAAPPSLSVDEEALLYAVRSVLRQHIRETRGNLDTEDLGPLSSKILKVYQDLAAEQWAKAAK